MLETARDLLGVRAALDGEETVLCAIQICESRRSARTRCGAYSRSARLGDTCSRRRRILRGRGLRCSHSRMEGGLLKSRGHCGCTAVGSWASACWLAGPRGRTREPRSCVRCERERLQPQPQHRRIQVTAPPRRLTQTPAHARSGENLFSARLSQVRALFRIHQAYDFALVFQPLPVEDAPCQQRLFWHHWPLHLEF